MFLNQRLIKEFSAQTLILQHHRISAGSSWRVSVHRWHVFSCHFSLLKKRWQELFWPQKFSLHKQHTLLRISIFLGADFSCPIFEILLFFPLFSVGFHFSSSVLSSFHFNNSHPFTPGATKSVESRVVMPLRILQTGASRPMFSLQLFILSPTPTPCAVFCLVQCWPPTPLSMR